MTRVAALAGGSLVVACVVAACGAFSANEDVPEPNEAAADAPASEDGSSGGPGDGGADASDADERGASWSLLFKDDFEAGLMPWNEEIGGSGNLFITAEGALRVQTSMDTPGFGYAIWQPAGALTQEELRIDVQVYPVKFGSPFPCVITVQPAPAARPSLRLQPLSTGTPTLHHEKAEAGADDHPFNGQLMMGKWNDVSIEIRFGSAPRGKVLYNGGVVLDVALNEPFVITRPQIGIGLTCDETNADFVFENVFVYAR
jgi:hypothetical protein